MFRVSVKDFQNLLAGGPCRDSYIDHGAVAPTVFLVFYPTHLSNVLRDRLRMALKFVDPNAEILVAINSLSASLDSTLWASWLPGRTILVVGDSAYTGQSISAHLPPTSI
jgi:hypothetical protein